jgi:predicted HTH transcriptional regulator
MWLSRTTEGNCMSDQSPHVSELTLSDYEQLVDEYLRERGSKNREQIANRFRLSREMTNQVLDSLLRSDTVTELGSGQFQSRTELLQVEA